MTVIELRPSVVPEVLDVLEQHRTLRAQLDAIDVEHLASLIMDPDPYRNGVPALDKEFIVEDVALALGVASSTAARKLHYAETVVLRFPETLAAMHAGRLNCTYTDRLIELTGHLSDEQAAAVEAAVLPGVEQQTVPQFKRAVARAVARIAPVEDEQRRERGEADRRVAFTPQNDATGELWALLPIEQLTAIESLVTQHAKTLGEQDRAAHRLECPDCADASPAEFGACGVELRTLDQRRADALCALVRGEIGGLCPKVNVTVSLATLLELSDAPGELEGHGPIPAAVARAIALDPTGSWRRLVTDECGRLVDVTSTTYRPPRPMARFVELRDRTCRFPTCNRNAASCELDHVRPWPAGPTAPRNLIPLCSRHHHLKHDARWHVQRQRDGTVHWTSPTGKTYDRPPEPPLVT
ncbi:HNH endonuclease signature motif containing protein [Jatrophihabitans fulvus]